MGPTDTSRKARGAAAAQTCRFFGNAEAAGWLQGREEDSRREFAWVSEA